ncbi:MAG: sigma-54 dependent transcriptional regulator [Deltaproteobacteria bacterium]|nr:sigma-54 dependent transcriptional regulator [Deltaproteobacteria bacterium]
MEEKILLVDDDPSFLNLTRTFLIQKGMEVIVASTKNEAVEVFDQYDPSLVVLDVYLPDGNGIDLIPRFRNGNRFLPIILVSGQSEIEEVVRAMQLGATDYVKKPFDYEELLIKIKMALDGTREKKELDELRSLKDPDDEYNLLFGLFDSMNKVRAMVDQVAETDITVLVTGESGTGKDLVAKAVHKKSNKKDNPFVKVNCAALPYELLESELFGYEKGAFTGAYRRKLGKFELASSGSIFLDEISEMPVKLQSKLLQVVQDRSFSRVGGERDVEVNTRIIAATNKDLEGAVKVGAFREDLYYRINVVNIHVPPLRERKDDMPIFVERFIDKYSFMYNKKDIRISDTLMDLFVRYSWPGNIRELENYIKRIVLMESDIQVIQEIVRKKEEEILSVKELKDVSHRDRDYDLGGDRGLHEIIERIDTSADEIPLKEIAKIAAKQAERKVIQKVLNDVRWNRRKAAKILQISYKALLYKMKDCGIVQNV